MSLANQAGSSPRSPGEPPVKAKPQPAVDAPEPVTDSLSPPAFLEEHTLVNTTWGRGGFELELAQGGVLRIGGKERARWQVIGSRIRLYDRRGEEHWLDIVDDRVTWNGQEVSRIR